MKQDRCTPVSLYLCLCFITLIIFAIIEMNSDCGLQGVNRATDLRLSRETDKERNKITEKELEKEKTPLKFNADFWHNHTRFACKSLGINTSVSQDALNLKAVVDDKHKLIVCPIAKAGSSYLASAFAILLGQDPAKDPKDVNVTVVYSKYKERQPKLRELSYEESLKRLKTFYSAILVREPFGRLLSAYRDKIEKPWSDYYANVARGMRRNKEWNISTTFPEFVAYVVSCKDDKDPHWIPYYQVCSPCTMNYDFVAKMETMHEDMKHIFEEVNVTDIIVPPKPVTHTADVYLEKYYKQVPKENLWNIYERYRPDFVIFDYSVPEVIKAMMV